MLIEQLYDVKSRLILDELPWDLLVCVTELSNRKQGELSWQPHKQEIYDSPGKPYVFKVAITNVILVRHENTNNLKYLANKVCTVTKNAYNIMESPIVLN